MKRVKRRPSIFIGSSGKSLPAAKKIKAGLQRLADVTLWSEHAEFREPTKQFLPMLLRQPEQFDFAVMILGRDDRQIDGKGVFNVPRHNVIFEMGLFMGHLGRSRVFPVIATGTKLFSDVAGLTVLKYSPPTDVKAAVKSISRYVLKKFPTTPRRTVLAYNGPPNVHQFGVSLQQEAERRWARREHVTVCNFALDLEATWGPLRDALSSPSPENLTWRSLMLDPEWPGFRDISSDTISIERAKANAAEIRRFFGKKGEELKRRNITFECRTYRSVPMIHGFMVNDDFLLLTILKRRRDGRVESLDNSYLRFPARNETTEHMIQAFTDWFDHAWAQSRKTIWPINKPAKHDSKRRS